MFLHLSVSHSVHGGRRAWLQGGGACMVGGCAWLKEGGVHGCGGGACVAVGGMRGGGGGMHGIRRDTVNERPVRILLECILVYTARQ